jgi:branched-chain amino acid transport system ATP-binding protein
MLGAHRRLGRGFLADALRLPSATRAERTLHEEVAQVLELLELQGVAGRRVSDLPFASRKRVELARALAGKPRVLMLDEPVAGLNHSEIEELITLLGSLRARLGVILALDHELITPQ